MKALVTSDWHLDWVTSGVERFADLEVAVTEVVDIACAEADVFLFLGDLCDPASNRAHRAVEFACWAAERLQVDGVPSWWMAGNHDVIEDGKCTTTLGPLRHVRGATVVDYPMIGSVGGARMCFLPFTPRSHTYDPEAFVYSTATAYPQSPVTAVLGHLNIEGIVPGSETHEMPRGRDVVFPLAAILAAWPGALMLNGHYHERQVYNQIHIPGSLERLTFGEEQNSPGFILLEV